MIDLIKYKHLFDKQVNVICNDGRYIVGEWVDWASALDNEPDPESITIKRTDGAQIEIFVDEIKEIEAAV